MSGRFIIRNFAVACVLALTACGSSEEVVERNDVVDLPEDETNNDDKPVDPGSDSNTSVAPKTSIISWVVSVDAAKTYLADTGGMLLDTRSQADFDADNIRGSERVDWKAFSMTDDAERGELLALNEIGVHLEGLTEDQWVFVIGDPLEGWGEDGRIVWMLQALGHKNAALIDGGFDAAKAADITVTEPKEEPTTTPSTMGDPDPQDGYEPSVSEFAYFATAEDVKAAIDSDVQLIDVREKREFDGETPYGESRGGHVPTAIHLHYKSLLDEDGNLLTREQIREVLSEAGIDPNKRSIAYCTGGVRSGWLTAVMVAIGIDTTNYAGSMWQWSSYPAADFPLE